MRDENASGAVALACALLLLGGAVGEADLFGYFALAPEDSSPVGINIYPTIDSYGDTVLTDNVLPYTGLGYPYTSMYDDGDVQRWLTYGKISRYTPYATNYPSLRVSFRFTSASYPTTWYSGAPLMDYTKLDDMLTIFDAAGLTAIPCSWDDQSHDKTFLATFQASWVALATEFVDDARISAFNLGNEPANLMLTGWGTQQQYWNLIASTIDAIHAVDADRVCIVPYPYQFSSMNFTTWLSQLQTAGITSKSYVMYDVLHPYYFENDWDVVDGVMLTPTQKATWYNTNYLTPAINAFGASKCWVGETFAWLGQLTTATTNYPAHSPSTTLQTEWLKAIMDVCATSEVSFQIWSSHGPGSKWDAFVDAESVTVYPLPVTAPSETYTVVCSAGAGGTVTNSGSNTVDVGTAFNSTASASDGYYLNYWLLDEVVYSTEATVTLTTGSASASYTLVAVFAQHTPQSYYVEAYAGQGGSVSPSGQTVVAYPGGSVNLTATASYGYTFTRWLLNGAVISFVAAITYSSGSPPNIYIFTAEFTADPDPTPTYTITASAGANGSITNSGANTVNVGTAYTSQATADSGYIFSHWTRDGAQYSTANPISLSLSQGEEATLAAVFIADTESPPDPDEPDPTPQPAPATPSGRFSSLLSTMEKQTPDGSIWDSYVWVSGLFDKCRSYRAAERQQEKAPSVSFDNLVSALEKKL